MDIIMILFWGRHFCLHHTRSDTPATATPATREILSSSPTEICWFALHFRVVYMRLTPPETVSGRLMRAAPMPRHTVTKHVTSTILLRLFLLYQKAMEFFHQLRLPHTNGISMVSLFQAKQTNH